MPRIDAWDVKKPSAKAFELGFQTGLENVYEWGPELGKGGFGTVRLVRRRDTGDEFACKSISKELKGPRVSEKQQRHHLEMISREVAVLKKLGGALNVVRLQGVFEDDDRVHIVMEYCRGGELWRRAGLKSFSEETVAQIMRAVLRTLAQCHAHRVLHRDVKPGNFMLLTTGQKSPVKAIDFGMAVFYEPDQLPRRDLGFDGTPWFMAPEVLSSQVVPASDLWSAGVMAYQLLTGYLPFDDRKSKRGPVLSVIWKGILTEEPCFTRKYWEGISDEAIDFVKTLLQKDPASRPTARQALKHPWVRRGGAKHTQLSETVVQRIQRFGQSSIFKRTVLDMVANELMQRSIGEKDRAKRAEEQNPSLELEDAETIPAEDAPPHKHREEQTWHNGKNFKRSALLHPCHLRTDYIARLWHGLAGKARKLVGKSLKKGKRFCSHFDFTRITSTSVTEWEQKQMLSREALDTAEQDGFVFSASSDGDDSSDFDEDELPSTDYSLPPSPHSASNPIPIDGELRCGLQYSGDDNAISASDIYYEPVGIPFLEHLKRAQSPLKRSLEDENKCGRGQSHYRQFVEAQGGALCSPASSRNVDEMHDGCMASSVEISQEVESRERPHEPRKSVKFSCSAPKSCSSESLNMDEVKSAGVSLNPPKSSCLHSLSMEEGKCGRFSLSPPKSCFSESLNGEELKSARPSHSPQESCLSESLTREQVKQVLEFLQFTSHGSASVEELTEGLQRFGYDLHQSEVSSLMHSIAPGNSGYVNFSQFLASQVDWQAVQRNSQEEWLDCLRQAFNDIDHDADGRIDAQDFLQMLRKKLPSAQVDTAVEKAAVELSAEELDMDFKGFVELLRVDSSDSLDSLDQYDARVGSFGQQAQGLTPLSTVPEC